MNKIADYKSLYSQRLDCKSSRTVLSFLVLLCCNIIAALTSCSNDPATDIDPIPDGYGRLTITISTPEAIQTRAVDTTTPWLEGTAAERAIYSYHLLVCNGSTILQTISGSTLELGNHEADPKNYYPSTETITIDLLPTGTYDLTFYCLANFTTEMMTATGLTMSNGQVTSTTLPTNFETKVMQPIANGIAAVPATGLPMTGKLTQNNVSIGSGTTISDPLILWRMMAKLEFLFTNESNSDILVKGIEVEPINQATAANSSGVFLISQDNLGSLNNLVPLFPPNTTKTVSATWSLDAVPTQGVAAAVSMGGVFASTALSWGSKVSVPTDNPTMTTYDQAYTLRKFVVNNNTSSRDNEAVITLKVTPAAGMSFTPKNISFKVCRGGTDGGKFDVEAGGNILEEATGVTPPRFNGDRGNQGDHKPPFYKEYSYAISGTPTTGEYVVKIYLYELNGRDYGFRDVVISGDVINNTGYGLQEHITLPSGALTDVGPVTYTPASTEQAIAGNGGTRNLFFYVNETDATFTTQENQLSLRFKIQRNGYTEELRYGVTTPYIDGGTGGNGFNVIRRNDWIHIPIHITDWQLRIEPLAFVPIAGYPATTLSSDALTATFSTGGMIALQPYVKKRSDSTWRDFSDPEVTFVSLTWKNSDGTDVSGSGKIIETPFTYDTANHSIVGELNNSLSAGTYKTTVTVNVKLGPSSGTQYDYSFTCNVILKKL